MQAKISLSSLLATLLAIGVIATPARVAARDIKPSRVWSGPVTPFDEVATDVGVTKPRPNGLTITPKDGDVPVLSTSVKARDLILARQTAGCVYITMDSNFGGTSAYICIATNGGCTVFSSYWRYSISSFGPNPYTICIIFTSIDCTSGGSTQFTYPGYGNLGTWNDNMGSFRCWW